MIWTLAIFGTVLTLLGAAAGWMMRHAQAKAEADIWRRICDNEYHKGLERGRTEKRRLIRWAQGLGNAEREVVR